MSEPTAGTEAEVAPDEAVEQPVPEKPRWEPKPVAVHRYKTPEDVADAAARRFLDTAKRAVEKNDRFIVVVPGGSTPRLLYNLLTEAPYREKVPWKNTYFAFSDERCVPPDDEASNYRMVKETLLDPLEIPGHHVIRMKGEQTPVDAARRYEVRLKDLFLNVPKRHFDLVLLGIGADGHTASLFPGTEALNETERWVVANEVPQLGSWRLTLTYKALNSARRIIFLATGEEKAQVVAEAFGGVKHHEPHPVEGVAPVYARREVLIDVAAASKIPQEAAEKKPDEGADKT